MSKLKKINQLIHKLNIKKKSISFKTEKGLGIHEDSQEIIKKFPRNSIDLIVTSPPFGLLHSKKYGNFREEEYIEWFLPFAKEFKRILRKNGSFVIDIGSSWKRGHPIKSLYETRLLLRIVDDIGFHLAQEFFWWNPSRLPTPAEWVTKRRIRVNESVNKIWWFSKSEWPKSDNKRILVKEKKGMSKLRANGYNHGLRPSGHRIGKKSFFTKTLGSIPSNLIAVPNTSNDRFYSNYCLENDLPIHPARFPEDIPEFFLRFLTNKNDTVLDPFAGSCVTGSCCERLNRYWVNIEVNEEYLKGAKSRFSKDYQDHKQKSKIKYVDYYLRRPGQLSHIIGDKNIKLDGGRNYKRKK